MVGDGPLAQGVQRAVRRLRPHAGHLFQPVAAVGARGLEVVTKFGFQIVVARCLSSTEAGLFLLGLSVVTIMQCAAKLAIDKALIPAVARGHQAGADTTVFAQILASLGLILLISGSVGLVIFGLASPIATYIFHKPEFAEPLRWFALATVGLGLLNGIIGAVTGLGAAAIGDVLRNFLWPALCAILMLLGTDTAGSAALAGFGGILVAIVASWLLLRRLLPVRWPPRAEIRPPPGLFAMALPLAFVDTIDVIVISVPTIVLGAIGSSGEVAIFSVANRVALIFIAIIGAIGNAASPRFALMADDEHRERLGRTVRDIALLAAACCLPLFLALLIFPDQVMRIFGPDYVAGATTLRILVVGNIVYVAFACCTDVLAMTGHGRALRPIRLALLIICLGMSVTLIPIYGAIGAALTTAVTVALTGVLSGIALNRRLRLPALPCLAGGAVPLPR